MIRFGRPERTLTGGTVTPIFRGEKKVGHITGRLVGSKMREYRVRLDGRDLGAHYGLPDAKRAARGG
jgi:hypothetical protein